MSHAARYHLVMTASDKNSEEPESAGERSAEGASPSYHAAGVLFHRPSGKALLQHRDAAAPAAPEKWSLFGGGEEPADAGNPVVTWLREMQEELEVTLRPEQATPFASYVNPASGLPRYCFYAEWPALTPDFTLHEGQGCGWFGLREALSSLDLSDTARRDVTTLLGIVGKV